MKKGLFVLSLCLLSLTSYAKSWHFATSATNPPFEFLDKHNKLAGFDIDLMHALCQQLKQQCYITNQAFDSLIASIKFRHIDAAIAGMGITEQRSHNVLFSQPYYPSAAQFVSYQQPLTVEQLAGKKIGTENGTTHQRYLQQQYPNNKVNAYDSYQATMLDLKNGRIDTVFGDQSTMQYWLKNEKGYLAVGKPIVNTQYFGQGMGIAVHLGNQALADKINQGLSQLKANGQYQTLVDKWLK